MKLTSLETVIDHIRRNRDELRECILGFSGGKEAGFLLYAVREAVGHDVPMVYASCPGVEWPEHYAFVAATGAEIVNTKHDWDWWERSAAWAFLTSESRNANRFARQHQRGVLRRLARSRGKVLLWGNRRADGNWAPEVRYRATDETELWMPLRDIPTTELDRLPKPYWSPTYALESVSKSGYPAGRIRCEPELRRADAREYLTPGQFERFDRIYTERFGAACK